MAWKNTMFSRATDAENEYLRTWMKTAIGSARDVKSILGERGRYVTTEEMTLIRELLDQITK